MPKVTRNPLRTPPTPWITARHPITELSYKFRIETHRRRGAFHIRMHKSSEAHPATSVIVRRSRQGIHAFVLAADSLLRASMWDPTANPDTSTARSIWRQQSIDYPMRSANAETVALMLPRLLTPQSGRPIALDMAYARDAAAKVGGTNVSHVTARARRRAEMLIFTNRTLAALGPLFDQLGDARRMKGYTAEEVKVFRGHALALHSAADDWRRALDAHAARPAPGSGVVLDKLHAGTRETLMVLHDEVQEHEENFGGVPLSPSEQALTLPDDFGLEE